MLMERGTSTIWTFARENRVLVLWNFHGDSDLTEAVEYGREG